MYRRPNYSSYNAKFSNLSPALEYLLLFLSWIGTLFIILASILIAYILSLIPSSIWSLPLFYTYELRLPAPIDGLNHYNWLDFISFFKPQWSLLVVLYWVYARPQLMGIMVAWLIGLGLDILQEGLIGEYALVFAIVAYLGLMLRSHLLQSTVLQQMIIIAALLAIGQLLVLFIQTMIGHPPLYGWKHWGGALGGALLWPVLLKILPRPAVYFTKT